MAEKKKSAYDLDGTTPHATALVVQQWMRRPMKIFGISESDLKHISSLKGDSTLLFAVASFLLGWFLTALFSKCTTGMTDEQKIYANVVMFLTGPFSVLAYGWAIKKHINGEGEVDKIIKDSKAVKEI